MTTVREVKALATAALLLVAITACADNDDDPKANGSSPSPTPMSNTSAPAPQSDSDVASAASAAVVHKYFSVVDTLRSKTNRPLSELSSVATSTQLSAVRFSLLGLRRKGQHQVGATRVARLKVQSINLDNSDPKAGKVPTVLVDVCWDVSRVDVVDKNGTSVVSPGRADSGWTRYTVANYHWSTSKSAGWRIANGEDLKKKPCVGS